MTNNDENGYGVKDVKAIAVEWFLTEYTDGNGEEEIRMGCIVGNEIRFLKHDALSKPIQSWLRNDILKSLGKVATEETAAPLPSAPNVETQV